MSLFISNEILTLIRTELNQATSSVKIITAFCKEPSIKLLNSYIPLGNIEKKLMLRFRLSDLQSGITDFSALRFALDNGWSVYIRFDLHAKTYIVDNKRGIIGSANATRSGLSIGSTGNLEIATLADIDNSDLNKIDHLFFDAVKVNEDLYSKLLSEYSDSSPTNSTSADWSNDVKQLFNPSIKCVFSHEFPDKPSYSTNEYVPFLDITLSDLTHFKKELRWSTAYLWLLSTLQDNGGELYFGKLSSLLHNDIVTDPKPYRKDIKTLLSNLLSIVETLDMEEVSIDRPNYSQRIRLK